MEVDFWIPRTLDDPPLFFIWQADVAYFYILFFILGSLLNMVVMGIVVAIFVARGYARLKEEGGKGLIVKFLYWHGPDCLWPLGRHPSYVREFFGG